MISHDTSLRLASLVCLASLRCFRCRTILFDNIARLIFVYANTVTGTIRESLFEYANQSLSSNTRVFLYTHSLRQLNTALPIRDLSSNTRMIRESISLFEYASLPVHSQFKAVYTNLPLEQYAISIRESLFEYANDTRIYLSSNTRISSCKHSQFIATQLTVTIARQRMTVTPRTRHHKTPQLSQSTTRQSPCACPDVLSVRLPAAVCRAAATCSRLL